MSIHTLARLDQEELQQLALTASRNGDGASAIAYLKEAVERGDAGALPHFLLGSEYAQIGLYVRAIGEMEAALALDPGWSIVRFQLGMLVLGQNRAQDARAIFLPLTELAPSDPLHHFGNGLLHLIDDHLEAAGAALRAGIACNQENQALNHEMELMLAEIERRIEQPQQDQANEDPAPDSTAVQHLFLSAYTGAGKV